VDRTPPPESETRLRLCASGEDGHPVGGSLRTSTRTGIGACLRSGCMLVQTHGGGGEDSMSVECWFSITPVPGCGIEARIPPAGHPRVAQRGRQPHHLGTAECCPPRHQHAIEPSFLEYSGILHRGEQYPPGPLPATLSTRITNLRVLSTVASCVVASNICEALR